MLDKLSLYYIFINKKEYMRNFGFNGMDDEEFRREFMRFLTMYQSGLENFMKKTYNNKGFNQNQFFSIDPFDTDSLRDLLKAINKEDMDIERGEDETGEWEKSSWKSPDGSSSFNSYSRSSFYNPFEGKVNFKQNPEDIDTVKLLENKLNKAIMDENYESAAKIRDLINNLKEDKEKENKK